MYDEISAGAVLYFINERSEPEFLILNYSHGHWDFPKGNMEKGETEIDTVRREVQEETSINDINIIEGFRNQISYKYRKKGKLVNKSVIYYLAQAKAQTVKLSFEHINYIWLKFDDALAKLSFENSKMVLMKAKDYIFKNNLAKGIQANT